MRGKIISRRATFICFYTSVHQLLLSILRLVESSDSDPDDV